MSSRPTFLQNASITVLVEISVNGGASAGQTVQVLLGDASTGGPSFDNQAANTSANEVRTVAGHVSQWFARSARRYFRYRRKQRTVAVEP